MPVLNILIDHLPGHHLDEEQIRRSAEAALSAADADPLVEATLRITDDRGLQELNRIYRGIDQTTDVLAFPDGAVNPENGHIYLGDVVIAFPIATEQAARGGHSVMDELALLVVHGILHLLGYDHDQSGSKAKMWKTQKRALALLGNPLETNDLS